MLYQQDEYRLQLNALGGHGLRNKAGLKYFDIHLLDSCFFFF